MFLAYRIPMRMRLLLIIFSPLVNYWFIVFALSTYSLLRIFNLKFEKENIILNY